MNVANALRRHLWRPLFVLSAGAVCAAANGYTLWSANVSSEGAGNLVWPSGRSAIRLPELTLKNLAFVTNSGFRVPYSNNGGALPNICGEAGSTATGRFSNNVPFNENVDACAFAIDGHRVLMTVALADSGRAEPSAFFGDDGELLLAVEFSLDFGSGLVLQLPLLSTTGEATVPSPAGNSSASAQAKGKPAYGSVVRGKLGDADHDGWIDGTLVATGVFPANAPAAAGEPFVLYRNFKLDVPVAGVRSGDVRNMRRSSR